MTSRTLVQALLAALILTLIGGAATALAMNKTVSIAVDGEERRVQTFASTVEGALQDAGLQADARDALAPTAGTPIADGSRIVLKQGRLLTLSLDGQQREVWTTALTVEDALQQIGMRSEATMVSADRSRRIPLSGMSLDVSTEEALLLYDGAAPPSIVTTSATTVGEMVAEQGRPLGPEDVVGLMGGPGVDPAAPVEAGMQVQVTRVDIAEIRETRPVEPPVERVEDPEMPEGEEKVEEPGKPGEEVVTYRVTTTNGQETDREELGIEMVTEPVQRIVRVGTDTGESAPSVGDGGVWDQLAKCESGGDWSTNTGNGYYGGLQFDRSTWNAYGGSQYADLPHEASREEQIAVAEKVRADRGGYGAWPACSSKLGLS